MNWEDTAKKIAEMIQNGDIAPWKAEQVALKEGVSVPEYIAVAAKARRLFIEDSISYCRKNPTKSPTGVPMTVRSGLWPPMIPM
jgi:hypothetical protein